MQRYFDVVQSRTGDAIVGGLVSVFISGTTTLATLYADNGVTLQANPVTTNTDGEYAFYAANGTYSLQITATNYATETKPGVVLFDPLDAGIVSVKNFGAKGDGVADDTAAINVAVAYMAATGSNILIPPGTYLTEPFSINSQVYAGQANFVGEDRERCILKRKTVGGSAFLTYGAANSVVFQSGVGFKHITIDGGAVTNGPAFRAYDVVRSSFTDVRFKGGDIACHLYGGISITFYSCLFDAANYGIKIEKFTSLAGGGWPNLIRISGGEIVDNLLWGAWFDDGRVFVLESVDVESNGTALASSQGGVYIGPNVGTEVSITDPISLGLVANNCWFEANRGLADVSLNSGLNTINASNFFSQTTMVVNDIVINGGKYVFNTLNCSFSKTANILENSGTLVGNSISFIEAANLSYDPSKTMVLNGQWVNLQQGRVPSINATTAPMVLVGEDATSSNPTITFPVAFKTATTPKVYAQAVNNSTGTIDSVEIYSISRTGFTMRKKSFDGATIGTSNYTVSWTAVGESP